MACGDFVADTSGSPAGLPSRPFGDGQTASRVRMEVNVPRTASASTPATAFRAHIVSAGLQQIRRCTVRQHQPNLTNTCFALPLSQKSSKNASCSVTAPLPPYRYASISPPPRICSGDRRKLPDQHAPGETENPGRISCCIRYDEHRQITAPGQCSAPNETERNTLPTSRAVIYGVPCRVD